MAGEKRKHYDKIKEGWAEDPVAGASLKKDLPLLATNLNNPKHLDFIFNEYRKEGLIPKKFKTAEQLRNYLHRRLFAEMSGIIKSDPSIKGDKGFKEAYFKKRKKEILEKLVQDEAISKLKPFQRTPEQLEQISKMRWTGLPIKVNAEGELKFHRRYFHDKVSERVINFANTHKIPDLKDGKKQYTKSGKVKMKRAFPEGAGDQWAKEMRASWNLIGEKNRALKAASGLSFDIGHFIPSILDGPNVGFNATNELSSPNRSKGGTPFSDTRSLARQLAIPETWMQAFTDWHLRREGLDPNQLPKDYQLKGYQVVDSASGYSDPNAEIAKNQARYKTDQELIDVVEGYKKQGIIPPETTVIGDGTKNPQIQSIDDIKKYSSARRAIGQPFKFVNGKPVIVPKKTPIQQILGVKQKTNKFNGISEAMNSIVPVDLNPPDNYEVNYTPRNPNGNGNGNGNGVNGKNGNGIAVNGKNGKNGILKRMENVKNYSGLGKLRDVDQIANIGLNVSTGNVGGAALGVATYGTSKAIQNKQVQARVAKQITKLVAERGAKSAAKFIPGLDILISGGETWDYLKRGRWDQAGIAALSGAIGWIPLIGDGASASLDLSNTAMDIARLQAPKGKNKKKAKNRLSRYLRGLNT